MHLEAITIKPELFPNRDVYPFNLPIFGSNKQITIDRPVVFFVGSNGSGKSTLIEAIARRANIHIWRGFQRARYRKNAYEDALSDFISLGWRDGPVPGAFFASELFKSFAQLLDEWASSDPGLLEYFGDRSLMTLSHGQGHMAYFENRFSRPGLYLLDEPETALSPTTQLRLLDLLSKVTTTKTSQFLIATHSPLLLSFENAIILNFDSPDLSVIPYEKTEHYRVYRDFFAEDRPASGNAGSDQSEV